MAGVSKDDPSASASSFETRSFGALLRMRDDCFAFQNE
jgi:hypothetical protein